MFAHVLIKLSDNLVLIVKLKESYSEEKMLMQLINWLYMHTYSYILLPIQMHFK